MTVKEKYVIDTKIKPHNLQYIKYTPYVEREIYLRKRIIEVHHNIERQEQYLRKRNPYFEIKQKTNQLSLLNEELQSYQRKWITKHLEIQEQIYYFLRTKTNKTGLSYGNLHKVIYQGIFKGIYNESYIKSLQMDFIKEIEDLSRWLDSCSRQLKETFHSLDIGNDYDKYIYSRYLKNLSAYNQLTQELETVKIQNRYDSFGENLINLKNLKYGELISNKNKYNTFVVKNGIIRTLWYSKFSSRDVLIDNSGTLLKNNDLIITVPMIGEIVDFKTFFNSKER